MVKLATNSVNDTFCDGAHSAPYEDLRNLKSKRRESKTSRLSICRELSYELNGVKTDVQVQELRWSQPHSLLASLFYLVLLQNLLRRLR